MKYIYDIVLRFMPEGLNGNAADIFLGAGCVALVSFLVFLLYKIARLFF